MDPFFYVTSPLILRGWKENLMKSFRLLGVLFLTFALFSCSQKTTTTEKTPSLIDGIVKRGELQVGLNAGYFPFEVQTSKGSIVGLDVALAEEMAKELGVKLKVVNTAWDGIIPSLMTNKFDMVISGMTITLERAQKVAFSDPYFYTGQSVLLKKSHQGKITDILQMNSPNYTVAVMLGTTGQFAVEKMLPKSTIKVFKQEADGATEVVRGRADAFVFDQPMVLQFYRKFGENKVALLKEPFTYEPLGIAVRRGDPDAIFWLNHFVRQIKGDGRLQAMVDKYMNTTDWAN